MEIKRSAMENEYYVAFDGKEFASKYDCVQHEDYLKHSKFVDRLNRIPQNTQELPMVSLVHCDKDVEYRWVYARTDEELATFREKIESRSNGNCVLDIEKAPAMFLLRSCCDESFDWWLYEDVLADAEAYMERIREAKAKLEAMEA